MYKVAPWRGGNPTKKQQTIQHNLCCQILKKEIEILKPKFVIFLTSSWESAFIDYLKENQQLTGGEMENWSKYKTTLVNIKGTNYIISPHPQGKKIVPHKTAIIKLINSNSSLI